MDSIPFPLRFIIALPFWLVPGLMISYFRKPEDFVIKRLRPNPDPRTWGLRLALIILTAATVVAGPTILILLMILTENFFS